MDSSLDNTPIPTPSRQERRLERREAKDALRKGRATKKTFKKILSWGFVILLIALGTYGMFKAATGGQSGGALAVPVSALDHTKGNSESPIQFVEYADFQCPACAAYFPMLKRMESEYDQKIAFIYRHFPLVQHLNAERAAQAAEAAGRQGKFWEMHDLLYENQDVWASMSAKDAEDAFTSYAKGLGLNEAQFRTDLALDSIADKIDGDFKSGLQSGVSGTPTFYLQGVKVQNPQSYDEFRQLFDAALAGGDS